MEQPDADGGEASRNAPSEPKGRDQGEVDSAPEEGRVEVPPATFLDVEDAVPFGGSDDPEGEGQLTTWTG